MGSDVIYRRDTIDAINTWDKFGIDERSRVVRWHEGLEPYVKLRDVAWAIEKLPSAQPEQPTEVQDILQYLDEYLHPIVSPEHWSVYSELYDMVSMLPSVQPPYKYDEWCTDCKEYDQTKHCCPRWNRVIRSTLEDIRVNNQVNLCDSCKYTYPDCPSTHEDVLYGNGEGDDNICACTKYEARI